MALLVAVALAALLFFFFAAHHRNSVRAEAHFEIESDLLDLRNFVLTNLVCPTTCTPNAYVAIPKAKTFPVQILINDFSAGSPSKYGLYLLRAFCSPCPLPGPGCSNGKRLLIQYMRGSSVLAPIADPLNGRGATSAGTAVWQDLFNAIPVGCPMT